MIEYVIMFEVLNNYVSAVTQSILITLFARVFAQYSSPSAMFLILFNISLLFITPYTNIGGGFCIFVELVFPSMEYSFVSFVNKPYQLCVSVFVSGVLCCVLCILFLLVRPRWCLHLIVVRGFEYVSDPESYTSGSVATGRASLAGQVKG